MTIMDFLPKLILASLLGFIAGLERSKKNNGQLGAGTTSILVLASTVLTIISVDCIPGADPSRLLANIIQAVGFLCGGVIFLNKSKKEAEIVGLTTGATLFALTGVGMAIGLGYWELAIWSLVLVEINIAAAKIVKKRSKYD